MSTFEAVSQVFADYAAYTDDRNVDGIGSLYADDGEMTIDIAGGGSAGPYVGRPALVEFIRSAMQGLTDQRRHVITNVRVMADTPDETTATGILTLIIVDHGDLRVQASGLYTMTTVRAGGDLKIRHMHLALDRQY